MTYSVWICNYTAIITFFGNCFHSRRLINPRFTMHQGLTRLPAIRWIVFRKLATTTKSIHKITQGPLSTNDMMCFPFSVDQSPVWSIVNLLDGESTTVTTKKMQELFVVRQRYFSSFRGNVGKFVLLDSKKLDGMNCECHASRWQVDITSFDL